MIEIILPIKIKAKEFSLNSIYSGKHWSKRKNDAKYIHLLVKSELIKQKIPKFPYKTPVIIEFYYNTRLDCSNHGYITKLIEDALKGWVIKDDLRKYVAGIYQSFWDGDGVKIRVREEG